MTRYRAALSTLFLGMAVLAVAALVIAPPAADARGGGASPQPQDKNLLYGKAYFDQSVNWVNDGKPGIHQVTDFYADLADVQFNVEGNHHEGYMRLWLKAPGKYRLELRPGKPMQRLTTKILAGENMWILHPNGRVQPMHGRPDGVTAIGQMKRDRRRLEELSRFLTLEGLKGAGVQFYYEGPREGSGTFAGKWIKIRRRIPQGADVTFHLAYQRDPRDSSGRRVVCTYPGVVTVVGDPRRGEPTEYYVLKNWQRGPQFRYPRRIEAYTQSAPGATPRRFLLAFPNDIRINTRLADSLFAPPPR